MPFLSTFESGETWPPQAGLLNGAAIIDMGVGLRAIQKGVALPPNPTAIKAAHHVATYDVIGQKSVPQADHSSSTHGVIPGPWRRAKHREGKEPL